MHRLLVCGWVPRGVAGDVGAARRLDRGGRAPHGRHRGGAARQSATPGQSVGVDGATALFHQFLKFGAFILKPDLHLEGQGQK